MGLCVLLFEFMPIGGLLRYEITCQQEVIDAQAGPCVNGGIALLGLGELGGFPIGELLVLADLVLKKDGINLLQAHVGDVVLLDELLQFNKSSRMQFSHASKLMEIIGGGQADLDNGLIFKEFPEHIGQFRLLQTEEEGIGAG